MTVQDFQPYLELVINTIKDAIKGVKKGDIVRINKTIRIPGYKTHLILSFGNDRNPSYDFTTGLEIKSIMPDDEYDDEESIQMSDKDSNYIDMEAGGTAEEIIQEIKDWVDRNIFDRFLKEKESYDYYKGKWVKTLDMTPTWVDVVNVYIGAIEDYVQKGRSNVDAIAEIRKMAALADERNEILNKLEAAGINWKEL